MPLTWLFHAHEDSFSRKWEKGKHILKDRVALERVSREEDGEEICLGPNAQDIPVHDFVQADVQFQVVKDKAVNSWKRAGCETFHQDLAPRGLPKPLPAPWGRDHTVSAWDLWGAPRWALTVHHVGGIKLGVLGIHVGCISAEPPDVLLQVPAAVLIKDRKQHQPCLVRHYLGGREGRAGCWPGQSSPRGAGWLPALSLGARGAVCCFAHKVECSLGGKGACKGGMGKTGGVGLTRVEDNWTTKFGFTQIFRPPQLFQPFSLAVKVAKHPPCLSLPHLEDLPDFPSGPWTS